ncbi:hypothetical protein FA15DRAFT_675351 [Coprinopsis marcescibilis]|uniref:Uncharacterized protein n=1 Tax=Coprinopsis marcescibilis TaxID=230819 RepID=A0A5C3KE20_COPMA|nr:hypothetical protein FA15DRAFT_675351 [Coprinopsis marcescibilis]
MDTQFTGPSDPSNASVIPLATIKRSHLAILISGFSFPDSSNFQSILNSLTHCPHPHSWFSLLISPESPRHHRQPPSSHLSQLPVAIHSIPMSSTTNLGDHSPVACASTVSRHPDTISHSVSKRRLRNT